MEINLDEKNVKSHIKNLWGQTYLYYGRIFNVKFVFTVMRGCRSTTTKNGNVLHLQHNQNLKENEKVGQLLFNT